MYNADGTIFGQLSDAAHKALAPRTYPCSLCRLTYGLLREKPRWRAFVAGLRLPSTFLHRDEVERTYPALRGVPLPTVLVDRADGVPEILITADELDGAEDLDSLERLVTRRVATLA